MYKVFLIFDRKFVIDSYPAAEIIAKRFGSQIEDLFVCNAIPDASRRCQKPYCQLRRSVHAIAEASTHIKRGDLIRFLARTCCTDADLMAQLFRAHWPVHTEYELVELLRDASGDKKSWREASAGAARVTSSRFLSFFFLLLSQVLASVGNYQKGSFLS